MKANIHPEYGPVAFRDISTGKVFVTRSTLVTRPGARTAEIDGVELPVFDVDITSDSHPFWTGRSRVVDTEGRIQAFERRYGSTA
ncbi:MAG TPA: type B 50S ribosomal protein L31 [Actinobacteria bacterium]|jgi:large subunit ribosomal protein L31|nr:type B 50S ribosomal protein L31 [Actinomycetota bacterium]